MKKNARKQSPHLRKNRAYFVLFHSRPNNIGPARQLPTDWGSLNFSESGRRRKGGGHSYYLLALRLLYYMRFAMEASREWKMGGTHSSPTALGLGISAPPPNTHPKFPSFFVWDWEGAQKCFILRNQTTGDLKSHHLPARVTLTALSVPPWPHFLSAEL